MVAIQTAVHYEMQQYLCRSLPHGEACYLVRIPAHIALLKKGYYCQTQGLFEVTTGHRFWSTCLR